MGWDHRLSCQTCREALINVARNSKLNRDKESLDDLEAFLIKHGDHVLVFDANDDWVRVPDCSVFQRNQS